MTEVEVIRAAPTAAARPGSAAGTGCGGAGEAPAASAEAEADAEAAGSFPAAVGRNGGEFSSSSSRPLSSAAGGAAGTVAPAPPSGETTSDGATAFGVGEKSSSHGGEAPTETTRDPRRPSNATSPRSAAAGVEGRGGAAEVDVPECAAVAATVMPGIPADSSTGGGDDGDKDVEAAGGIDRRRRNVGVETGGGAEGTSAAPSSSLSAICEYGSSPSGSENDEGDGDGDGDDTASRSMTEPASAEADADSRAEDDGAIDRADVDADCPCGRTDRSSSAAGGSPGSNSVGASIQGSAAPDGDGNDKRDNSKFENSETDSATALTIPQPPPPPPTPRKRKRDEEPNHQLPSTTEPTSSSPTGLDLSSEVMSTMETDAGEEGGRQSTRVPSTDDRSAAVASPRGGPRNDDVGGDAEMTEATSPADAVADAETRLETRNTATEERADAAETILETRDGATEERAKAKATEAETETEAKERGDCRRSREEAEEAKASYTYLLLRTVLDCHWPSVFGYLPLPSFVPSSAASRDFNFWVRREVRRRSVAWKAACSLCWPVEVRYRPNNSDGATTNKMRSFYRSADCSTFAEATSGRDRPWGPWGDRGPDLRCGYGGGASSDVSDADATGADDGIHSGIGIGTRGGGGPTSRIDVLDTVAGWCGGWGRFLASRQSRRGLRSALQPQPTRGDVERLRREAAAASAGRSDAGTTNGGNGGGENGSANGAKGSNAADKASAANGSNGANRSNPDNGDNSSSGDTGGGGGRPRFGLTLGPPSPNKPLALIFDVHCEDEHAWSGIYPLNTGDIRPPLSSTARSSSELPSEQHSGEGGSSSNGIGTNGDGDDDTPAASARQPPPSDDTDSEEGEWLNFHPFLSRSDVGDWTDAASLHERDRGDRSPRYLLSTDVDDDRRWYVRVSLVSDRSAETTVMRHGFVPSRTVRAISSRKGWDVYTGRNNRRDDDWWVGEISPPFGSPSAAQGGGRGSEVYRAAPGWPIPNEISTPRPRGGGSGGGGAGGVLAIRPEDGVPTRLNSLEFQMCYFADARDCSVSARQRGRGGGAGAAAATVERFHVMMDFNCDSRVLEQMVVNPPPSPSPPARLR